MACKILFANRFAGILRCLIFLLCLILPSLGWSFAGGTGTVDDPYLVQTAEHLNEVRNYLSSHFLQIADIDLTDYLSPGGAGYNDGAGWEPIGSYNDYYQMIPFTGTYDGDGFVISNLFFDHSDLEYYYVGLFGFINETATLSNITLENVNVTGYSVGSLVGYSNGNIYNCSSSGIVSGFTGGGLISQLSSVSYYSPAYISDSHSSCEVTTVSHAAGLIYLIDYVQMVNCFATGNVVSEHGVAAGLVSGAETYSIVENCYATGYVTGATAVGGLISTTNYLTLRESYATGNVYLFNTNEYSWAAGGLVASGESTLIVDCYATGDVMVSGEFNAGGLVGQIGHNYQIQNSYSTGRVTSNYPAGGFVGYSYSTVSVENSFWDIYTSGRVLGIYGEGHPTPELLQQATFTNWDFDEIWQIDENSSYPYLRNTVTVEVPSPPDRANDIGVLTVLVPELTLTENDNAINVIVYNMGSVPQSNFPVILMQEGVGDLGIIQVTETIGQYEQIEVEFIWNPSEAGMTSLWGVVDLPGDEYEPNDSSVPVSLRVYKDFDGGEGTIDAPYLISEAEQFLLMKYYMDAHYLITADIDMGFFAGEGGWTPLGYYFISDTCLPFNGRIDGQNHILSNLSLTFPAMDSLVNGFIAYLGPEGTIENLIIDNVNVYGYSLAVGGLVGRNEGEIKNSAINSLYGDSFYYYAGLVGENFGLIEDCRATIETYNLYPFSRVGGLVFRNFGTISGSKASVEFRGGGYLLGGLVSENYETGVIIGSFSTGKINNPNIAGGLAGFSSGEIINSHSSCQIIDGLENIGGLVGENYNLIESCYATGSVSGEYRVAGLVGVNHDGTINNSYSHGNVMGIEMIGGLVGASTINGHIQYCYSVGNVLGADDTGGLIGFNHGTVVNSYWDTQTSGQNSSQGGEGRTTAQMMQQATFEDWDFENVWKIIENESYPYLFYQDDPVSTEEILIEPPAVTKLIGNYPNPFNPVTTIVFSLAEPGKVKLEIFNIIGQRVRILADQHYTGGEHHLQWDGRDDRGVPVSSGIYFTRLIAEDRSHVRKMMLLK